MATMPFTLIIPAAGSGSRMGLGENKLFLPLQGAPVLWHTLRAFAGCPGLLEAILAIRPGEELQVRQLLGEAPLPVPVRLVAGGDTRQQSVLNALKAVGPESGAVWVHDGARPFVSPALLGRLAEALETETAVIPGVPVKDTIKRTDAAGFVTETPDRSSLWAVQTPQCFRGPQLLAAHEAAAAEGFVGTDDASLMERAGHPVRVIPGEYDNIKITTPEDLAVAVAILTKGGRKNLCG